MSELSSAAKKFCSDNCDPDTAVTTKTHSHITPITMLTADILFFIFSMNSRMEMIQDLKGSAPFADIHYGKETLTTNRYSSQVCRRWRTIILSSPTIWANSLNIEVLNQCGDYWRLEVLARTRNAPISLVGSFGFAEDDYAIPFVLDILVCEWHRIQYLSICTRDVDIIEEQMLRSLQKPAPCLEYLDYRTDRSDKEEPDPSLPDGEMLFSNKSPKLTFICCEGFSFEFTPGSVSNVRHLWLTGDRASFTIPELYRGLQHLPLLAEFTINHYKLLESAELSSDRPDVHLPHLSDIIIQGLAAKIIMDLVRYIIPAPGCRLVALSSVEEMNDVDVSNLSQVYATFIRNITNFQPVQYILLSSRQSRGFAFRAADSPRRIGKYSSTYLDFDQYARALDNLSIPIMKALASRTDFDHVSKLELRLDETTVACFRADLLVFLKELGSVSALNANLPTLRILTDIQATTEFVILPCTTTIIVVDSKSMIDYPRDYLTGFMDQRLARGVPVQILSLPKRDSIEDGRWNFLDQFRGLSVLWGSGSWPEDDDEDHSN